MPVQKTMAETSASEFWEWMKYLDDEERKTKKWEIYASRIHASILRLFSDHPEKIKDDNYIVKYREPVKIDKTRTYEQRVKESKSFWSRILGIPLRKK